MNATPAVDNRTGSVKESHLPWLKYTLMFLVLTAILLPFLWPLMQVVDSPIDRWTWMLVWVSGICNIAVVLHYTVPPHPKFLMVRWRHWVLRTHIAAGTIELFSGIAALFTGSPIAASVMAIAALGFHVPSAALQTPIVFGSRAVMWPGYTLCIALHAFCAAMLLINPTSGFWAVNTFLVFNVYVWCRIYYYAFDLLGLFSSMKYTIAILAAGVTILPAVLGPMAFLILAGFVGAFILLYKLLFLRTPGEYEDFLREKARDSAISREVTNLWDEGTNEKENQRLARYFFDMLDTDKDGALQKEELQAALSSWGLPDDMIAAFVRKHMASGSLDFEQFNRHVWSIGAVRHRVSRIAGARQAVSERDKAEFVFHQLDLDQSGTLSAYEMQLLLLEWGLPGSEVEWYFARCDSDGDGEIPFDDFFHKMRPVWRFIFYEIIQAEAGSCRGDMFGRELTAFLDARRTACVKQAVKQDLLSRVRFLWNADETLIADLASSLITETFRAGATIFDEESPGDKFYLVGSGAVRITADGEQITELLPGGCIGEGALLTDAPRLARATAIRDCTLYSMTRASFDFIIAQYPGVKEELQSKQVVGGGAVRDGLSEKPHSAVLSRDGLG